MLSLYQYRLPFITPHQSGSRTWTHREGVILHYTDGDFDIVSEAAPLPGVSRETLPEVILQLKKNLNVIDSLLAGAGSDAASNAGANTGDGAGAVAGTGAGAGSDAGIGTAIDDIQKFSAELDSLGLAPSSAFAVSAAGISLISQRTKRPLNELLGSGLQPEIKVNSVIGVSDEQSISTGIDARYREGFRTIKLKSSREPGSLPGIIEEAAGRHSDLTFRIDANRSWPSDKAVEYLNRFAGLPVEYCEEPCQLKGLDELAQIRTESAIRIALDESITGTHLLRQLLQNESADVLIIKPPLFGNILSLTGTILENRTQRNDIVFTSSMDSGIARTVTGWLAAMAGSGRRSHGLDTGRFFKEDICPDPVDNALFHADTVNGWSIRLENCNIRSLIFLTSHGS